MWGKSPKLWGEDYSHFYFPFFLDWFSGNLERKYDRKCWRGFIYLRRMVLDLCNAIVICLAPVVVVEVKPIANFVHFSSWSHKVVCSFVQFSSCSYKVVCSFGERLICNCTCCELVKQNFAVAANVRNGPRQWTSPTKATFQKFKPPVEHTWPQVLSSVRWAEKRL